MKTKITKSSVKKALAGEITENFELCDTEIIGFRLLVRKSGRHTWVYKYRMKEARQWRTLTIGRFNDASPEQARDEAKKHAAKVVTNTDPQQERRTKQEESKRKHQSTLKTFFEDQYKPFLLTHLKRGNSSAKSLERNFVKQWGSKQISQIDSWLITKYEKERISKGIQHSTINRELNNLKAMLNRCPSQIFVHVDTIAFQTLPV